MTGPTSWIAIRTTSNATTFAMQVSSNGLTGLHEYDLLQHIEQKMANPSWNLSQQLTWNAIDNALAHRAGVVTSCSIRLVGMWTSHETHARGSRLVR
jgi:hypothetical protein